MELPKPLAFFITEEYLERRIRMVKKPGMGWRGRSGANVETKGQMTIKHGASAPIGRSIKMIAITLIILAVAGSTSITLSSSITSDTQHMVYVSRPCDSNVEVAAFFIFIGVESIFAQNGFDADIEELGEMLGIKNTLFVNTCSEISALLDFKVSEVCIDVKNELILPADLTADAVPLSKYVAQTLFDQKLVSLIDKSARSAEYKNYAEFMNTFFPDIKSINVSSNLKSTDYIARCAIQTNLRLLRVCLVKTNNDYKWFVYDGGEDGE